MLLRALTTFSLKVKTKSFSETAKSFPAYLTHKCFRFFHPTSSKPPVDKGNHAVTNLSATDTIKVKEKIKLAETTLQKINASIYLTIGDIHKLTKKYNVSIKKLSEKITSNRELLKALNIIIDEEEKQDEYKASTLLLDRISVVNRLAEQNKWMEKFKLLEKNIKKLEHLKQPIKQELTALHEELRAHNPALNPPDYTPASTPQGHK